MREPADDERSRGRNRPRRRNERHEPVDVLRGEHLAEGDEAEHGRRRGDEPVAARRRQKSQATSSTAPSSSTVDTAPIALASEPTTSVELGVWVAAVTW